MEGLSDSSTPRMTHCIWIKLLSVVSGYAIFRERGVDQYYRCLRPVFSGPTTIQPAEIPMWISHVLAAEILIIRWWTDPKFPSNHGITCRTSLAAHLRARKGRCYPIFQANFLKIFGGSLMWMCWFREKICRKPLLHSHAHFLPLFPYIYCTCLEKTHSFPFNKSIDTSHSSFSPRIRWMSCKTWHCGWCLRWCKAATSWALTCPLGPGGRPFQAAVSAGFESSFKYNYNTSKKDEKVGTRIEQQ